MIHTSGSTSKPKRVMLTHKNLFANARSIIQSLELRHEDRTLVMLPLMFASANTSQMITHLYLGATVVLNDTMFNPRLLFRTVEQEHITNMTIVPSMLMLLLDVHNTYDISTLRTVCFGGGPTPVLKIQEIVKKFHGIGFVQMYGQTEASTRITHLLTRDFNNKMGSVGKPLSGIELKIVDQKGQEVKRGKNGEIIVRGDNIMKGYYKKPEATAKTIVKGWLHTGDIARMDNDGFVYITGRVKNIINSGGKNIYPEEVEEVMLLYKNIKEVRVFAENDEFYGEVPVAEVVRKDTAEKVAEDEIINYCIEHLSDYKVPARIYFVDAICKTPTGKIKRN